MRKLPTYLAAAVLTFTVDRVAHFFHVYMNADWPQAWGFAISIAAGVWLCSYLTREHVTPKAQTKKATKSRGVMISDIVRKQARIWRFVLIVADGIFNLSDVVLGLPPATGPLLFCVAVLYGSFPTILAAGLGSLQGAVDRLPASSKRPIPIVSDLLSGADAWAARWAAQMRKKPAKATEAAKPAGAILASSEPLFKCSRCDYHTDPADSDFIQQKRMAGHSSSHTRADKKAEAKKYL